MRTLLLTGPGGAGASTLAAAAAVRAARSGRRTLLLTAAPPPGWSTVPGLTVDPVAPLGALESLWDASLTALSAAVPGVALPPPSSVVPLPGARDLALLARLARAVDDAEVDRVVVDAGPLPSGAALVGLPGVLRWWLHQALPTRLRMLGAVRTAAVRAGAVQRGPVDAALDAVPALEQLLGRVDLTDPATTEVRLVAPPRPDAVPVLRAAVTALALHGQRPTAVHTRVLPADGAGEWWRRRGAEQEAVLAALAELAPVRRVEESPEAPEDVVALAALLPDGDDDAVPAAPFLPVSERVDGGRRLVLALPFAEREGLELTRWQDDLVVTVAGARRSIRLDALLRRCLVTAGQLADAGTARARLEVTFTPDPQQWPADLLAAEGSST
ncbi:ArsA family ATPase [Geodermatophilus sabuli]|uniref:Arsenite efflux ATP-binding protein ArsA n=1 Tax=Geodermatophilus sabuli TaxID=1564158 RepID=A0A285E786_9ACTN|nr:ArsA-related P-loop ATPase [Geodermatophilus sabuli]MBB3082140.1 arsenite-transporting ATPase [Geodermatophilus sabuli]SNX94988.1 arsenite efflux ATP-binding protein ArsA [Geodermatophilus sabuli]